MVTIKNETGGEYCRWCADEGWVELKGTVDGYSRGSAPCKWCETGMRRFQRMRELRIEKSKDIAYCHATDRRQIETDYGEDDVEAALDYQPVSQVEARKYLAQIRANMERMGRIAAGHEPQEVIADEKARAKLLDDLQTQFETPEAQAEIAEKQRKAKAALEPELPPDPAPAQPDYSDVPF